MELSSPADDPTVNGVVVVVSATPALPYNANSANSAAGRREAIEQRFRNLEDKVRQKAVPIHHVYFSETTPVTSELIKFGGEYAIHSASSSQSKDGKVSNVGMLQRISATFLSILSKVGGPRIEQTHKSVLTWHGQQLEGTFRVEEGLRTNLWVVLTTGFKEDVEVFEITSPSGRRHSFPKYDHGIVYFYLEGPSEAGIWTYTSRLHHSVHNGALITLEVFGEHSRQRISSTNVVSQGIRLKSWTNVPANGSLSPSEEPVIIYASLTEEGLPLIDARVVAVVTRPGSMTPPVTIMLKDNGIGDPDVTKGDGVYSAYLTEYSSDAGTYSFQVFADHNNGLAKVPKPAYAGGAGHVCCGSSLPEFFTVPTQPFERFSVGSSFNVDSGVSFLVRNGEPRMKDIFSPGRISDLKVTGYANGTLYATMSWTAPGSDLDSGPPAAMYEIRCYTKRDGIITPDGFVTNGILVHESLLPAPAEVGTQQDATVSLPWANEVFFYAIVAVDEAGNRGAVSNLAAAYVVEVTTTTQIEMSFKVVNESGNGLAFAGIYTTDGSESPAVDRETMVYVVAAAIVAFVVVLSALFFAAVVRARRRRRAAQDSSSDFDPKDLISAPVNHRNHGSSSATSTSTLPDMEKPVDPWKTHPADDLGAFFHHSGPISWPYPVGAVADAANVSGHQPYYSNLANLSHHHPGDYSSLIPHPTRYPQPPLTLPTQSVVGLPLQDFNSSSEMASSSNSPTNYDTKEDNGKVIVKTGKNDSGGTASTDCSANDDSSDQNSDKNVYNVPSSRLVNKKSKKSASSASSLKLMSAAERIKKRQESLV